MTHDQKVNYMRIASSLANFGFTNKQLDLLVSLYDLVNDKQGNATIDDVTKVTFEVEERNLSTPGLPPEKEE